MPADASADPPVELLAELDRAYPLSADHIDAYRRDGFVHLSGVFSPELLAWFGARIARAVAAEDRDQVPLEQRDSYGQAFTQIPNLWPRHADVRAFSFNRRCARIATELLECSGVRMWHDQALFKEAGGGKTAWHIDQFFWPMSSDRCVTAWVPLQATAVEEGALQFAAGAQNQNHGRHFGISDRGDSRIAASLADAGVRVVAEPFALGDVSFHSGLTYHRAEPNRSERTRAVMTVIYIDEQMRIAPPEQAFQEHDRQTWAPGCEVGDPIASPLNPVLYSRR